MAAFQEDFTATVPKRTPHHDPTQSPPHPPPLWKGGGQTRHLLGDLSKSLCDTEPPTSGLHYTSGPSLPALHSAQPSEGRSRGPPGPAQLEFSCSSPSGVKHRGMAAFRSCDLGPDQACVLSLGWHWGARMLCEH